MTDEATNHNQSPVHYVVTLNGGRDRANCSVDADVNNIESIASTDAPEEFHPPHGTQCLLDVVSGIDETSESGA